MNIIKPITIIDSMLTSSNVPDVDNIGTSTTSLLIAVASKTFTTQAGLPFVAGEWVKAASTANAANYMYGKITSYTSTTLVVNVSVNGGSGTLADWKISYGYDAAATYLDGDQVQISTPQIHKVYESLVSANVGNYPPTDVLATTPKWLELDATNRWKVFDNKVGSQTSQATTITYKITPGLQINSIALLNLDAAEVVIVMTDPTDGVVYNQTISLLKTDITGGGSIDWYSYFFSSFSKITDVVRLDIPPYLSAVIDITVNYTGSTAKVGTIVLGVKTSLGTMKYSPSVGITDYSTKTADVFGNYTILERAWSKKVKCSLIVPNTWVDDVLNILAYYRSTLLVWIGSEDYTSLMVYGFYKSFDIVIPYPNFAECSLEIEGLI